MVRIMRTLGIVLVVLLAGRVARAQAPGLTMSFDPGPPMTAAPMTAADAEVLETGEIGVGRWALGVGVSAYIGFGLGQTVQGRWHDTGWIFTVGESVSLTVFFLTVPALFAADECDEYCHGSSTTHRAAYLAVGSLLAYAAFRAWDFGDAIVGPAFHNRRFRDAAERHPESQQLSLRPFIVPSDRGSGGVAGLSLSF